MQIIVLIPPNLLHLAKYSWHFSDTYFHILFTVAILWYVAAQIAELVNHFHYRALEVDVCCPTPHTRYHHLALVQICALLFQYWCGMLHAVNRLFKEYNINRYGTEDQNGGLATRELKLWPLTFQIYFPQAFKCGKNSKNSESIEIGLARSAILTMWLVISQSSTTTTTRRLPPVGVWRWELEWWTKIHCCNQVHCCLSPKKHLKKLENRQVE